jgi:hypothetical protein
LSRYWRRSAGRRGSGDAWRGWLPRGVQIVAASFEDRTAVACAAMLDALGASFSPADGLSAMARLTSNGKCFLQVRRVSVIARGWKPQISGVSSLL